MKRRVLYMHTLDGKPALYYEAYGSRAIAFAGVRDLATLATSLNQIRREQKAAMRDNERIGLGHDAKRLGYVRVEVPA